MINSPREQQVQDEPVGHPKILSSVSTPHTILYYIQSDNIMIILQYC